MDQHPVNKDKMADEMGGMRSAFGKSMAPIKKLGAGTMITRDLIMFKKPATGIPASLLDQVIGKRLIKDVTPDHILNWDDLES
jgi:sialic acid synthase SpsE